MDKILVEVYWYNFSIKHFDEMCQSFKNIQAILLSNSFTWNVN